MIDEDRTMQLFLHTSDKWNLKSHKPIVVVCEECGTPRVIAIRRHKEGDLCKSCALKEYYKAPKAHEKASAAMKTKWAHPQYRETMSIVLNERSKDPDYLARLSAAGYNRWSQPGARESQSVIMTEVMKDPVKRDKISVAGKKRFTSTTARENASISAKKRCADPDVRKKLRDSSSEGNKKRWADPTARERQSAARQGISYDEWEGFAMNSPYCPKFNEACRESNRGKYDHRCFLSDVTESENGQKLSVHHIDMDKNQGCDGHAWKLVPLCRKWHNRVHTSLWMARIQYLLMYVWATGRTNVVS